MNVNKVLESLVLGVFESLVLVNGFLTSLALPQISVFLFSVKMFAYAAVKGEFVLMLNASITQFFFGRFL